MGLNISVKFTKVCHQIFDIPSAPNLTSVNEGYPPKHNNYYDVVLFTYQVHNRFHQNSVSHPGSYNDNTSYETHTKVNNCLTIAVLSGPIL